MATATTTSLREQLAALQTRAATAVAAVEEKVKAERQAKVEKRVEMAAEKRLEKHVDSQFHKLSPAEREALLAWFDGDEAKAQKAAAEILKGMTPDRQRYLKFAGWAIVPTGLQLQRIAELEDLRRDAEAALESYKSLPNGAEKDEFVATATNMLSTIDEERAELDANPLLRFFSWEATLSSLENAGEKRILAEVESGLKGGYLRELSAEEAEEIVSSAKKAKAEGREEKHLPFMKFRRPKPVPDPADWNSLVNFRYFTYAEDSDRERESRNRMVFYALNRAWSDHLTARKESREAFKGFQEKCVTLAELAEGKDWVGIGDISKEDPWIPKRRDETKQLVPMTHRGTDEVVKNWGPVIAVVAQRKFGQVVYFPVLNREVEIPILDEKKEPVFPKVYVASGMFMPLLKAGAWDEDPSGVLQPVEFRFEAGKAFAGLRPASREIWRDPWQLKVLKAIARKAGKLEAPLKEETESEGGGTPEEPQEGELTGESAGVRLKTKPRTRRGRRSDGSGAGEPRNQGANGQSQQDDGPSDHELDRIRTAGDAENE